MKSKILSILLVSMMYCLSGISQSAFTAGNLVVLGIDTTPAASLVTTTGTPIYLYEYTTSGTFVQKVAMKQTNGVGNGIFSTLNNLDEAKLCRSANGQYLTLSGYSSGIASALGTTTVTNPRTIALVKYDGTHTLLTPPVVTPAATATITTTTSTATYNSITASSGTISSGQFVYGPGLPIGTTVVSYIGSTLVLSATPTSATTSGAFYFMSSATPNYSNVQGPRAVITDAGTNFLMTSGETSLQYYNSAGSTPSGAATGTTGTITNLASGSTNTTARNVFYYNGTYYLSTGQFGNKISTYSSIPSTATTPSVITYNTGNIAPNGPDQLFILKQSGSDVMYVTDQGPSPSITSSSATVTTGSSYPVNTTQINVTTAPTVGQAVYSNGSFAGNTFITNVSGSSNPYTITLSTGSVGTIANNTTITCSGIVATVQTGVTSQTSISVTASVAPVAGEFLSVYGTGTTVTIPNNTIITAVSGSGPYTLTLSNAVSLSASAVIVINCYGIKKYTKVGSNWTMYGGYDVVGPNYRGLVAIYSSATSINLFAIRNLNGTNFGNQLIKIVDNGGPTTNLTPTETALRTAFSTDANGSYRSLALVPQTPTYYYNGSGALNSTASWGINTDGTGLNPADFTSNSQTFYIQNTSSATLTNNWTVSGTNSKIVVGDGIATTSFTIPSNFTFTGTINVANNATLVNQNTAVPSLGTLATGSTVNFGATQTMPSASYYNLIISSGTVAAPSSLTLTGSLTINSGATFTAPSGTLAIAGSFTNSGTFTHNSGNVTFNGGSNQTIPAATYYSITISNSANTALGGNITVNGGLALTIGNLVVGANTITLAGTLPTRGTGFIDATNSSANIAIAATMTLATSVFTGNIYNLTISSGTTTAPSSLTLTGGLTINSGASFTSCSGTLSIGGNFSNAGTFNHNNGNVTFNGSSSQQLGAATFNILYINTTNSATVSMTGNVTVITQLFPQGTTGNLIVGANTLTMGTTFSYVGAHVDATNTSATIIVPNTISLSTGGFVSSTFNNLTINNNATLTSTGVYTINGILTIANGSTLNMGTNAIIAGASFSTSGTGTLQTQNVTSTPIPSGKTYTFDVLYNSASAQTVMGSNYNNLNLTSGNRTLSSSTGTIAVAGTYTQGAGTMTTTGSTLSLSSSNTLPATTFANLIIAGGAISAPSSLTLTGSLTINSGGTFVAPSGTLNVAGSFSNSGTFTHSNGTVNLNGTSQVISGSTSFYNFTKAVSSAATLTFPAGLTQTFAGTLTLTGVSGNLLSIVSSTPTIQAIITPTANNWSISYVQVSGNDNNCGTNIVASNVTNKGNNTGWTLSPASYVWTGANSTNWNDAANWNLSSTPSSSDNVTITKTGSNNLSIETSASVASFAISGSNTVTLLGGNTLTVNGTFNNSGTFTGASTSTVAFSGTSTISGGASSFYHLTVNSGATLTTAVNFSIAGNFTNSGTFTASASAITFNGSSAQSIASGTFYNLTIFTTNNANVSMTGNVTVNNTLSTAVTGVSSSGSLIVGSNTLTLGTSLAYISSNPHIDASSTSATIVVPNTISLSMGGFVSGAVNNLTINNNATLTATASYTINGVLNIANGSTLNMGTNSINAGSSFSTTGTGLLKTQSTSSSSLPASHAYTFNVEYNSAAATQILSSGCAFTNLTISNSFGAVTVTGGSSSTVNVSGILEISASSVLNMGTSTLLGTFTTSGTGTLQTQSVSATPIPSGRTFTFDVLYNSASAQTVMGGNYNNLNLTGGNRTLSSSTGTIAVTSTYTQGAGTMTTSGSTLSLGSTTTLPSTTYANLIVAGGTITAPSLLTLTGSLTINIGATFIAPSNTLNIAGNYTNSGTFTHNSGLVNLNGTNQTVSGSSTFYRFTKSVSAAYSLTFASGQTQSFLNALTLTGVNGNLLTVNASTVGSQAYLTPTSGLSTVSYAALKDLNNNSGTTVLLTACTDNGNNSGFSFATVPGTPASITATADNAQVFIDYTAPVSNGGATIIDYTITAIPSIGSNIIRTGVTANPYTFTGLTNNTTYTFTIAARNSVGTGSTITSSAATPSSTTIWNGTTWSAGTPDATQIAVIAGAYTSSTPITCTKLTVNTGVTFINNSTITVTSSPVTINGTVSGTGTVVLAGSSAQSIAGTGTVCNLTLNNAAGATVSGTLGVTGVLNLQSGTLTTGGNVILKSTSIANSGILGPVSAGAGISGNITVERYIPKGFRAYRDMSANGVYNPANTLYNTWQEGGSYAHNGYGMFITGILDTTVKHNLVDATTGIDHSLTGYASAYYYNNGWNAVTNTKTTTLNPFQSFRVLVRGDRSFDLDTTPVTMVTGPSVLAMYNATTLRSTGVPITGDVTFSTSGVTNAITGVVYNSSQYGLNNASTGYTYLANPYACPIVFDSIYNNSANIKAFYYYLDPTIGSTGAYVSYNAASHVSSNGATYGKYIQAGQGFLIGNNNSSSPVVVLKENYKATGANVRTSIFGAVNPNSMIVMSLMKSGNNASQKMDGAVAVFGTQFSNGMGVEDNTKFSNASDNLSIKEGGLNYSIDGRLPATINDVLGITLGQLSGTKYQLVIDASGYTENGLTPYLVDAFISKSTALSNNVNTIDFTTDANVTTTYQNRFSIVFKPTTLTVNSIVVTATANGSVATITWNTVGEKGVAKFEVEKSTDGASFSSIGQQVAKNTATASYTATDKDVVTTTFYRIKAINTDGTVAYSNIAKLTTNNSQLTTIFPNPLTSKTLNIQLVNVVSGKYVVSITNVLGQKVAEHAINHSGSNGSHSINIESKMAKGVYSVVISSVESKQSVYQTKLSVR